MERERLNQRLIALFLDELEEHRQKLERGVLELSSAEAPRGVLEELFRSAHTLKGAAQSVGANEVGSICHDLEHIFQELLSGRAQLTPHLLAAVLAQVDALNGAATRVSSAHGSLPAPPEATPAAEPKQAAPARPARTGGEGGPQGGAIRVHGQNFDLVLSDLESLHTLCSGLEEHLESIEGLQAAAKALTSALKVSAHHGSAGDGGVQACLAQAIALESGLDRVASALQNDLRGLRQSTRRVSDDARSLRMVPFSEICEGLERAVRELSSVTGKELRLTIQDNGVEVDRAVAQRLRDPILHVLRNAASHGIEGPSAREAAGKPRAGQLTIAATLQGSELEVDISDDGRGLDLEALRARAVQLGVPPPSDDKEAAQLVFAAGLSTAAAVTPLAGRGVGLDAVRRTVEGMHGSVRVVSEPGRGTRFHLRVPLHISTLRCILMSIGGQKFSIPCSQVVRVLTVRADALSSLDSTQVVRSEGQAVPVLSLAHVLGLDATAAEGSAPALVIAADGRQVALVVDELLGESECILRPLPSRLSGLQNLSGIATPPSGRAALVLNGGDLARAALRIVTAGAAPAPLHAPTQRPRLLVVDDSLTTRTLLKSVLEGAGYEVVAAGDGAEAWHLLQGEAFSLVVSDVQMPNMDGVTLTQTIRQSAALARLPVVLVTALGSDEDRRRGLEAGATAYLTKTAFDQRTLLDTIASLV